mgnify:CR=1
LSGTRLGVGDVSKCSSNVLERGESLL